MRLPLSASVPSAGLVLERCAGCGGHCRDPAAPQHGRASAMNPVVRWIARRRVALGFAAGGIALWLSRPTPQSLALGAAVAIAGEMLRIWAAGHLEKGREVTSSGPYRWMRHPLYAGSTIVGIGLAIGAANWLVAVLVAAYLTITLSAAIATEEADLTRRFGE